MKYHLNIYFKKELVNTFESEDPLKVLKEFKNCMVAKFVRDVKVQFKKLPYQDKIKIVMTWPNSMPDHKYVYEFEGLCED